MISPSRGNVEDPVVGAEIIEEGILHFDATARRRDRMRSKANSEPSPVASPAQHSQAAPKVSPAPTIAPGTSHDSWKSRVQQAPPVVAFTKPVEETAPVELAAAVPATAVSNTAISTISEEEYRSFLVGFVVEQTGYPEDIVELDSDLEADLGIDSIKVAQMMGELQERFELDLTKIQIKSLDELRTLRQIIQVLPKSTDFVTQKSATPTNAQALPPAVVAQPVVLASVIVTLL